MPKAPDRVFRIHPETTGHPQKEPFAAIGRAQLRLADANKRGAFVRVFARLLFVRADPTLLHIAVSAEQRLRLGQEAADDQSGPRVLRQDLRAHTRPDVRQIGLGVRGVRHVS